MAVCDKQRDEDGDCDTIVDRYLASPAEFRMLLREARRVVSRLQCSVPAHVCGQADELLDLLEALYANAVGDVLVQSPVQYGRQWWER